MKNLILKRSFYTRPTLQVAQDLLGKYLVFGKKSGMITEVEAYIGFDDKACHAARGQTKRNEIMFRKGGFAYIYLIYGIYHCLNITTEKKGFPSAILIRSLDLKNSNGPGKLCREFGLTRAQNGLDVTRPPIYIEDRLARRSFSEGGGDPNYNIIQTPRIGIDYSGKSAELPWRFLIDN